MSQQTPAPLLYSNRLPFFPQHTKITEFLDASKHAKFLAVDTETTGYEIRDGSGHAMGISLAYSLAPGLICSGYFPFRHVADNYDKGVLAQVKDAIESADAIIMHNSKFDLVSLETLGIKVDKFYDTMLMAHMCNENLVSNSLDFLSKWYLKDSGKEKMDALDLYIKTSGWDKVPSLLMYDYTCKDAELTLRLFDLLHKDMEQQGFYEAGLWDIEQDFVRVINKMESRGVLIDQELSDEQYRLGCKEMRIVHQNLRFNPGSTIELGKHLIDYMKLPVVKQTPKGKPSFDKFAMAVYDEMLEKLDNDDAKQILTYRGWQKTTSSNYKAYTDLLSPDGRLRPNYKIHGTVTGRLSCEKPNLQQIPRSGGNPWNGQLKKAFIAKEGFTLIEADYSQLELRLAAAYADEKELLAVFSAGRDVFTEMAEQLGMARHDVKTLTYTIQYGGGIRRISSVFGLSETEAAAVRENFYITYPGFRRMSQVASSKAKSQGYLKLWTGRRRHFMDPRSEAHKAFNSVIQGGAAEIMKRTMIRMFNEVDCEDARMLLQVHDSIVFEVRTERMDEFSSIIQKCMEAVEPDFGVFFAADVHIWGS